MGKANPTIKTQNRILNAIRQSDKPLSLTAISKRSGTGFNEVKSSIEFFQDLGIIEVIISSGTITLVQIKRGKQNEHISNEWA